ncbi:MULTISPECIES: dicarboxylate/amino acid:cation symporter [Clostridium]|uniref:Dicarboxylate/amino acid:cation symporter n=1 Tax=Clostridium cadaveris TaxID=1529 RepID=A0A1I2JVZ2_9CLOT|nr:dicarboxylate/amino acid:cation symporter [Clostridium cadaveris]MDU4952197.1 dicarboxylate/amino acid:cation symporter [Clostridium sp.]MDM8313554.1 dicarboxylate/amino acid:cation symporter [Clostridium cadaveris]MDY4950769.1 dicarboxylate/amino acid:cation symporter [Clostridium cadaveris]NME64596.1 dicarboxylate/amino acid:cation symporter [Clostridium cadaveris]NWK10694.1 dicarboxylate/amino acid:cation symporter [Clostridium cadaveris]
MKKLFQTYKSSILLLACMIIGAVSGYFWGEGASVLQPIADIFLNLLYCSIVPLIFVSLVSSIGKMKDLAKLRKVLLIMLVSFIITGIIASLYMVFVTGVFDPAKGTTIAFDKTTEEFTGSTNFLSMFTVNDFPGLLSRKNLMALMVFTIIFAISLVSIGEKGKVITDFMDALSDVILKLIGIIMKLAPLGLGCYFAILMGQNGKELIGPLSRAIIVYLVAVIIYYALSNTLFAYIGAGREGVRRYWKHCITPTITALGTCSSAASIPVNLIAAKEIGVSDDIADISIPMGANLHKDGACIITILKIAFMCSVFNIPFLTVQNIITAVVVSVVASTVMGAIPAGGYVGEIFIVSAFGFPQVSIPIMVLIGTITDAPATAINVTGDVGIAMIISRFVEGKNWLQNKLSLKAQQ